MRAAFQFLYTDGVLRRALGAHTMRLQAHAHNLANANTPGFKRFAVEFETALQRELQSTTGLAGTAAEQGRLPLRTTHPRHLPMSVPPGQAQPRWVRDEATHMRNDGNNVDPDREMAELARTQLTYQALTRVVADRYRRLRSVLEQGGR